MPELLSRRLLWAIFISAALHFLLVFNASILLPDWSVSDQPIEVSLAPTPQPPETKPEPQPQKLTSRTKAVPRSKAVPKPLPVPQQPSPPPPAATPSIGQADTPVPEAAPTPVAEAPLAEQQPLPPIPDEPIAVPPAPKHVEIEFRGLGGSKGMGKQVFDQDENNRYRLTGEMSMPLFLFVSGTIEQHSEGLITPQGLQPLNFRQKITGNKPQTAAFDWDTHHVVMDTGKRTDTLDLLPGTQDMLSFMYQFMFVPPLDEMRMTLVTGKRLRTYVYTFEGEEPLDTKMGTLHTVHIGKNGSEGDEKTELWLAADYRYLPVRIRRTEKDGSVIDLVATRLTLTE